MTDHSAVLDNVRRGLVPAHIYEMGNGSHFRCPYHGWSYRNDGRLIGLPFHAEAYGGEAGFARRNQRLLPAPSLGTYNGLIFVSLDPSAPPLREYLGDFAFYLDFYTKQSAEGIRLVLVDESVLRMQNLAVFL